MLKSWRSFQARCKSLDFLWKMNSFLRQQPKILMKPQRRATKMDKMIASSASRYFFLNEWVYFILNQLELSHDQVISLSLTDFPSDKKEDIIYCSVLITKMMACSKRQASKVSTWFFTGINSNRELLRRIFGQFLVVFQQQQQQYFLYESCAFVEKNKAIVVFPIWFSRTSFKTPHGRIIIIKTSLSSRALKSLKMSPIRFAFPSPNDLSRI